METVDPFSRGQGEGRHIWNITEEGLETSW